MSQKHLIFSPQPPSRCGVGTYAAEHLAALKDQGFEVTTVSPLADSEAGLHVDLKGIRALSKSIRSVFAGHYDVVHVHYVDGYQFPRRRRSYPGRLLTLLLQVVFLRLLCAKGTRSSGIVHEIHPKIERFSFFSFVRSVALAGFDELLFHTAAVSDECRNSYPSLGNIPCKVIDHSRFMRRNYHGTRESARSHLNLSPDRKLFLCLGFLNSSKGFDDVVAAFSMSLSADVADLHIVGSANADCAQSADFMAGLRQRCLSEKSTTLHEVFLTDEEFDCWLMAADIVLLPYKCVVSSGVGARAHLYGKKIIIRSIPNLLEQFPDADSFSNPEELAHLLKVSSI